MIMPTTKLKTLKAERIRALILRDEFRILMEKAHKDVLRLDREIEDEQHQVQDKPNKTQGERLAG